MGLTVWVGVAARLEYPLPNGVDAREMLRVGVWESENSSGLSFMVKSSQEACGAAMVWLEERAGQGLRVSPV